MRLLRCAMALGLAMALTSPVSAATFNPETATPAETRACIMAVNFLKGEDTTHCLKKDKPKDTTTETSVDHSTANLELELLKIDNQARMDLDAIKRQNSEYRTKVIRREMRDWRR